MDQENSSTPVTNDNSTQVNQNPPSNLLAAYAINMLFPGLWRTYSGRGNTRFILYIVFVALLFIPIVNFIAIIGMIVLTILGIIDAFHIHGMQKDLESHGMTATKRDLRYTRGLHIFLKVVLVLYAIALFIVTPIAIAVSIAQSDDSDSSIKINNNDPETNANDLPLYEY